LSVNEHGRSCSNVDESASTNDHVQKYVQIHVDGFQNVQIDNSHCGSLNVQKVAVEHFNGVEVELDVESNSDASNMNVSGNSPIKEVDISIDAIFDGYLCNHNTLNCDVEEDW